MPQVVDGVQQQLPQRHQAGFAVDGGALPGVGCDQPERAGHLSPGDGHEVEFFVQIMVLVAQRLRVAEAIGPEEQRTLHRHGALHPVGEELLAVGDVADHFERTPLAGDRAGAQLLAVMSATASSEFFDCLLVRPRSGRRR
jgi:hypothetical protein